MVDEVSSMAEGGMPDRQVGPNARNNAAEHFQFLVECYRAAKEENFARIKRRDTLLEIQLFAQAVLFAIAQGISVPGVGQLTQGHPLVLALAMAVSLVLASLYVVEDRLIGYLQRYLGAISAAEKELTHSDTLIVNWAMSAELREYARKVLPVRAAGQVVAFLLIPAALIAFRITQLSGPWTWFNLAEILFNALLFSGVTALIIYSIVLRRQAGIASASPVLLRSDTPYPYGQGAATQGNRTAARFVLVMVFILLLAALLLMSLGYVIGSQYPLL
jgi:hypothetical protein